jgi:methanogenic corrinoid protein MtbC1
VLIGGAPATRDWVTEIGADGFASNAVEAVARARDLLGS